jgi:spore maturation protein SpmA
MMEAQPLVKLLLLVILRLSSSSFQLVPTSTISMRMAHVPCISLLREVLSRCCQVLGEEGDKD